MDIQTINTPEKLHQAIGTFLQSDYSHENLIKMYDDTRKCAIGFRGVYLALPALPAYRDNPLDGLQDVMDWCNESSKVVDDIISNLKQQTISEVISLLKKLRGFADCAISLVDSSLKEQAQKEARAKVEKEYKNLNEEASKTEKMPLLEQITAIGKLQIENLMISRRENEDAVQIYLSKAPTFKDRLSQLHDEEVNKAIEALNKLVGSDTSTGKLLDIYCKLKDIPLQRQLDDVGYAYCLNDYTDMICCDCNRLYTSIDTVIKTFEEIQTKAEQKADRTVLKKPASGNKAGENKERETKNEGNTYNISAEKIENLSVVDKSQHAGGIINTPVSKTKKEKGIWVNPYVIYIIAPILVALIVWGITEKHEKIKELVTQIINPPRIEYELPKLAIIIRNDTEQDILVERRAQFNIVMFSSMGHLGTEMGSGYIQLNPLEAKNANDTTQILIPAGKAIDIDAHFLNASIYRGLYESLDYHVIIVLKDSNGNIARSEAIPFEKDSLIGEFIHVTFKKAVQ